VKRIFVILALFNVLLFAGTVVLGIGLYVDRQQYFTAYFLVGLFTTLYTTFVQSLIFIYFLGTGKWVKDTVAGKSNEASLVDRTKKLKGMTFGFATYAAMVTVWAAISGAMTDVGILPVWVHPGSVAFAIGLNVVSYFPEAKAIGLNADLLDDAERLGVSS
jgi:hypothetical protein